MTQPNDAGLRKINRALISVSDKTGVVDFGRSLKDFNVEIISTGGTAKILREAGIEVRDVADVTGFPEMMDGRVKTLHPRIHGALLALRSNPEHVAAMQQHGIEPIDMVVVNLYPFEQTISREGVMPEEAIEQIDIGGPAMIRSAAKNWEELVVITSPGDYSIIDEELKNNRGSVTLTTRRRLAQQAFLCTASYDLMIGAYLDSAEHEQSGITAFTIREADGSLSTSTSIDPPEFSIETFMGSLPSSASWSISKKADLRYGENPHQLAALYRTASRHGIGNAELLSGKEMSFNNYVDADAAWQLVCDFEDMACAIIKHTNPAGMGLGNTAEEAYRKALATDPVSAFGGIVAFNRTVDEAAARNVIDI